MKSRNARFVDDLLSGAYGGDIYKHIRDGHRADLAEIVAGLERLLPSDDAIRGLVNFAYMMLEARGIRGSDEVRERDRIAENLRPSLGGEQPGSGTARAASIRRHGQ